MQELVDFFPFILLGYLTQEELIARQTTQKNRRRLTLYAFLAFIVALGIWFFTKSTPPGEQPDYAHEAPELVHDLNPKDTYEEWEMQVINGKIVCKISNPGGGGGGFDDERFWRERLEQLVQYIIALREAGELYEAENLIRLNSGILKEICAICARFGISLHNVLVRALGPNYVVHIVFMQEGQDYVEVLVALYEPGITTREIMDSFLESTGEFVGVVAASGRGVETLFEEFSVVTKITAKAWGSLVEGVKKFFHPLPPPPPPTPPATGLPGGPLQPN